jgi:CubicO group peptidase (beta-lactamase class C family)
MMFRKLIKHAIFYCFSLFFTVELSFSSVQEESSPSTITELKAAIIQVLEKTKTPAVGLALINKDSTTWITGLGKADVERNIEADENTMFRIGSTSKMYVSLAILKLCEEGRLSLKDKVRELAPEIEFINAWSETNPILVEQLLEHTTGWDDMHLADYALNADGFSLKEGLDYHPHSRISRWIPGTRMSYCNSGPPVAAYIIEKITGQTFEDYIQQHFFQPMGMENMTYFATDMYKAHGATLYMEGKPQKYWNISVRPSGSINASPKDMARTLRFFIDRGLADRTRLISEASLKRMETTVSTIGAKAGLQYGYGLSNYSSPYKQFVYRSHNGGVNGGLTDFSYLPEHNLGYVVMINSGSGSAQYQITQLIREFQTKEIDKEEVEVQGSKPGVSNSIEGYYIAINPRIQLSWFLQRIIGIKRIWTKEGHTHVKNALGGWPQKYLPAANGIFYAPETGKIGMVKTVDPLAGAVLHNGTEVLQPVSPLLFYGQLFLFATWIIGIFSSIIFGIYTLFRYFKRSVKDGSSVSIALWPFIASLAILFSYLFEFIATSNPIKILGSINFISVSIMVLSITFACVSVLAVIIVIKERNANIGKSLLWHSAVVSLLHLMVTGYLMWHGMIGLQTWSY